MKTLLIAVSIFMSMAPLAFANICEKGIPGKVVECINPADTSQNLPSINRLDFVMYNQNSPRGSKLFLWMNGTQGKLNPGPAGGSVKPLRVAVDLGYRAISVPYDNQKSVVSICSRNSDPDCSAKLRKHRLFNGPESISQRVISLLKYLDKREPNLFWSDYLKDGHIRWDMVAVSGQSQGAGMAAFIAKHNLVDRAILFSSPWDFQKTQNGWVLAPWIYERSVTPPDRWFGGYHVREQAAKKLERAYNALNIPENHIRRFNLDLDDKTKVRVPYPEHHKKYHGQGIINEAYKVDWLYFLGASHGGTAVSSLNNHEPEATDDDEE